MVFRKLLLGVVLAATVPAFSQTLPHATRGGIPLTVGAGYSNFNPDWSGLGTNSGRLSGYTIWADWAFYRAPGALSGIAVEAFGRNLNFNRTGDDPKIQEIVGGGGVLYAWRHFRHVQPYGKLLFGYGGINMTTTDPNYTHDTRTVAAQGLGVNFIFHDHLVIRADYETQQWPDFMRHHSLTPGGVTIGLAYDFKSHY